MHNDHIAKSTLFISNYCDAAVYRLNENEKCNSWRQNRGSINWSEGQRVGVGVQI